MAMDSIRLTVPATPPPCVTRAGAAGSRPGPGSPTTRSSSCGWRWAKRRAAGSRARGRRHLAVDYEVAPDCLRIDLRLTGLSGDGHAVTTVPEVAAAVLDASVDEWELLDGGGASCW